MDNPHPTNWNAWPLLAAITLASLTAANAHADDWLTWPSTYTHEPNYGQRIDQYALPEQPVAPDRTDFQRSGYRHYRSTLQAGQSADNMHIVEQWGRPVVPYEQWRFPFRPYAVPYDAWGPQAPYGIFNGGFGQPPGGLRPGFPYNPGSAPGSQFPPGQAYPRQQPGYGPGYAPSRGFPLQPSYQQQPWFDGTYPDAPPLDQRSDEEFFRKPSL